MEVSGWGRFPVITAQVHEPIDFSSLQMLIASNNPTSKLVPRGSGCSYGDSALAQGLISSRFMDNFAAVDEENKTIRCGAGVKLEALLRVAIPRGWFLPVVPGTRHVTVGGAIAADIHGKNHHQDGCFSAYVIDLTLLLANGELISCSESKNSELFHATCGGMGLTGIIIDATLQMQDVAGVHIKRQSLIANNLKECFDLFEHNQDKKYSVAWLDCLATKSDLGRSVVYFGEHAQDKHGKAPQFKSRWSYPAPFTSPSFLLNKHSMGLFNSTYFNLKKKLSSESLVNYDSYFFPLDNIRNWNRLYGANGFLQYQFLIPEEAAFEGISAVLNRVARAGKGSFLSVLKKMGPANNNLLSFPASGYTLALDFKFEKSLFPLLEELDDIVLAFDGRLYLAKDARMNETVFKAGYKKWDKFLEVKNEYDPMGIFASQQSDRIGLTNTLLAGC